jgi:hypothetical protein
MLVEDDGQRTTPRVPRAEAICEIPAGLARIRKLLHPAVSPAYPSLPALVPLCPTMLLPLVCMPACETDGNPSVFLRSSPPGRT